MLTHLMLPSLVITLVATASKFLLSTSVGRHVLISPVSTLLSVPELSYVLLLGRLQFSLEAKETLLKRCFRCLASDHLLFACRDPIKCSHCHRSGHKSFQCKTSSTLNMSAHSDDASSSYHSASDRHTSPIRSPTTTMIAATATFFTHVFPPMPPIPPLLLIPHLTSTRLSHLCLSELGPPARPC